MMLISLAASRRGWRRSIFLVARCVRLSGSIKILLDGCPESSKNALSSSGAAPDVAPVSNIPAFCARLLNNFRAQCAATVLPGFVSVTADSSLISLVCLSWFPSSSCLSTRQVSGDQ